MGEEGDYRRETRGRCAAGASAHARAGVRPADSGVDREKPYSLRRLQAVPAVYVKKAQHALHIGLFRR